MCSGRKPDKHVGCKWHRLLTLGDAMLMSLIFPLSLFAAGIERTIWPHGSHWEARPTGKSESNKHSEQGRRFLSLGFPWGHFHSTPRKTGFWEHSSLGLFGIYSTWRYFEVNMCYLSSRTWSFYSKQFLSFWSAGTFTTKL